MPQTPNKILILKPGIKSADKLLESLKAVSDGKNVYLRTTRGLAQALSAEKRPDFIIFCSELKTDKLSEIVQSAIPHLAICSSVDVVVDGSDFADFFIYDEKKLVIAELIQRINFSYARQLKSLHLAGRIKTIAAEKAKLENMAHLDMLTMLPNRRQFERIFNIEISRAKRHKRQFALLFIDLDKFKSINDSFGHNVGDELLKEVAKRIGSCVRNDDYISRIAGDEFAVLLTDIKQAHSAGVAAQKIVEALGTSFSFSSKTMHIGASIGIACYPHAGESTTELSKHADIAMYASKEQSYNNYSFFNESNKN